MSNFTLIKKNPAPGEVTSSLTNAESGRLHFDGATGNIDIASPPDLGTKFSFEFVAKADSWLTSGARHLIDFGNGGRFVFGGGPSTSNLQIYDSQWRDFGVSVLDDLNVHHLVVTVDGSSAVLYDNGIQVGTLTLGGNSDIDSCSDGAIGSYYNNAALSNFNGTISQTRFYNRVLSGSEVKEKFENKNLEFSDIYGSQTKKIDSDFNGSLDGWDTYNDWNTQTNNSNAMQLGASAATQVCRNNVSLVGGKKYRVEYTASALTGAPTFNCYDSGIYTAKHTITAGSNSFEMDWPVGQSVDFLYIRAESATAAVTLDDIFVYQIGAVSSYELQTANPTQSLMVQDSSGAADGTCSASGVSQIQPLTQLNSKAISVSASTARTPIDGAIVADKAGIGTGSPGRLLELSDATNPALRINNGNSTADIGVASSAGALLTGAGDDDLVIARNGAHGIAIGTNGTTRMAISSAGLVTINQDGLAIKIDGTANTTKGIMLRNTGNQHGYLQTDGNLKLIAEDAGKSMSFYTADDGTGAARMVIDSAGVVNVGAQTQIQTGSNSDVGLLLGADSGASTLTNSNLKRGRLATPHYTNSEKPVGGLYIEGATSANNVNIGGGSSLFNAATLIRFWTAANNTTDTGTARLTIDATGLATFSNGIVTSEKGVISGSLTIADDAVTTITPARKGGWISIVFDSNVAPEGQYPNHTISGQVFFDCGTSLNIFKSTAYSGMSANLDVSTSDVAGTTGTDGNVTVAVQSAVVKIENRSGGTRRLNYTIIN